MAKETLLPQLWKNGRKGRGKWRILFRLFITRYNFFYALSIVNTLRSTLINNQLMWRSTFDLDIKSAHGPTCFVPDKAGEGRCRARRYHVKRLSEVSYTFYPNLQTGYLIFAIGEINMFCRLFSTHQRPSKFCQTPGRPHISPAFVWTLWI